MPDAGYHLAMTLPPHTEEDRRQEWAEDLARRIDGPMSVLGVLFLLVVLGQALAERTPLVDVLSVFGWLLWLSFVGEYCFRLCIAPRRLLFVRRTWWQILFLLVPFLRFLRLARVARFGRLLSSAVRGGRSAGRLLSSRLAWLGSVSSIVALAASQVLYTAGDYATYGAALHEASLSTITGEPLSAEGVLPRVMEVALACYSVVVFATLAASLGTYFLTRADQVRGTGDREA